MNKVYFQVIFVLMIYFLQYQHVICLFLGVKIVISLWKSQISGKYLKKNSNIVFQRLKIGGHPLQKIYH
jgi:hypothetical protein